MAMWIEGLTVHIFIRPIFSPVLVCFDRLHRCSWAALSLWRQVCFGTLGVSFPFYFSFFSSSMVRHFWNFCYYFLFFFHFSLIFSSCLVGQYFFLIFSYYFFFYAVFSLARSLICLYLSVCLSVYQFIPSSLLMMTWKIMMIIKKKIPIWNLPH